MVSKTGELCFKELSDGNEFETIDREECYPTLFDEKPRPNEDELSSIIDNASAILS